MPEFPTFIEALRAKQRELGEGDECFARRLGISRGQWVHLRHGNRQPTPGFVREHVRPLWPELVQIYLDDLNQWISRS